MLVRDGIDAAVMTILQEYSEAAEETVGNAISAVTKETAKSLRNTAPKDTGEYAKGWTSKMEKRRMSAVGTVYNRKKPNLAHLLEHGHGPGRRGWRVAAVPHIAKAAAWAEEEMVRRLTQKL